MTKTGKKPYAPPRLALYGNIAKLTQGGGTFNKEDGQSNMDMFKTA